MRMAVHPILHQTEMAEAGGYACRGINVAAVRGILTLSDAVAILIPLSAARQLTLITWVVRRSGSSNGGSHTVDEALILLDVPGSDASVAAGVDEPSSSALVDEVCRCFPHTKAVEPNGAAPESGSEHSDYEGVCVCVCVVL